MCNRIKYPERNKCINRIIILETKKDWQLSQVARPFNILHVLSLEVFKVKTPRFLWDHYSIVNADVVDEAGEEGSGFHSFTGAYVQAAF